MAAHLRRDGPEQEPLVWPLRCSPWSLFGSCPAVSFPQDLGHRWEGAASRTRSSLTDCKQPSVAGRRAPASTASPVRRAETSSSKDASLFPKSCSEKSPAKASSSRCESSSALPTCRRRVSGVGHGRVAGPPREDELHLVCVPAHVDVQQENAGRGKLTLERPSFLAGRRVPTPEDVSSPSWSWLRVACGLALDVLLVCTVRGQTAPTGCLDQAGEANLCRSTAGPAARCPPRFRTCEV